MKSARSPQLASAETRVRDYYAVYDVKDKKSRPSFYCNVFAYDEKEALLIAKNHGARLTRLAFAKHIGKAGYYAALARSVGQPPPKMTPDN